MGAEGSPEGKLTLQRWDAARQLRAYDPVEARYSRGYLRSRPEQWFPGFSVQWLPLLHSVGSELRNVVVTPEIGVPPGIEIVYSARVDGEPMYIACDKQAARIVLDAIASNMPGVAGSVVLEYLARRIITTLSLAWTGPESSVVKVEGEVAPQQILATGCVRCEATLNGVAFACYMLVGQVVLDRLDWLWRRQVHQTSKNFEGMVEVGLELVQLAVPPSALAEYIRSGTVVDLEHTVSDSITLRVNNRPLMPARLCLLDGRLGFEVESGAAVMPSIPEGTTRVSVLFGSVKVDAPTLAEVSQVGSVNDTGIPATDTVYVVINNEVVATATLCTFEGRFAMSVR